MPTFYQFLIQILEMQSRERAYAQDIWDPLIDSTYELLRKELVYLDFEIKVAMPTESEKADELAAGIMAILLSADSPFKEQILERLFNGIDQSFTVNVRANRYMTRLTNWLHDNVLTLVLDQAANLIASTVFKNRQGLLSDYISTPRAELQERCKKALSRLQD